MTYGGMFEYCHDPPLLPADCAQHMQSDGGTSCWRWADREAPAEGRELVPQVQGQEEQLAQGTPLALDILILSLCSSRSLINLLWGSACMSFDRLLDLPQKV